MFDAWYLMHALGLHTRVSPLFLSLLLDGLTWTHGVDVLYLEAHKDILSYSYIPGVDIGVRLM